MPLMSIEEAHQRITDEERERSLLITDPRLDDNPIVFANDAFIRLTGYSREEVLVSVRKVLESFESHAILSRIASRFTNGGRS